MKRFFIITFLFLTPLFAYADSNTQKVYLNEAINIALKNNIEVFQPETLKDNAFLEQLEKLNPEVIIVVAYGRILPEYILNYPKYGCINIHASLLPKYRGAGPIQW